MPSSFGIDAYVTKGDIERKPVAKKSHSAQGIFIIANENLIIMVKVVECRILTAFFFCIFPMRYFPGQTASKSLAITKILFKLSSRDAYNSIATIFPHVTNATLAPDDYIKNMCTYL